MLYYFNNWRKTQGGCERKVYDSSQTSCSRLWCLAAQCHLVGLWAQFDQSTSRREKTMQTTHKHAADLREKLRLCQPVQSQPLSLDWPVGWFWGQRKAERSLARGGAPRKQKEKVSLRQCRPLALWASQGRCAGTTLIWWRWHELQSRCVWEGKTTHSAQELMVRALVPSGNINREPLHLLRQS